MLPFQFKHTWPLTRILDLNRLSDLYLSLWVLTGFPFSTHPFKITMLGSNSQTHPGQFPTRWFNITMRKEAQHPVKSKSIYLKSTYSSEDKNKHWNRHNPSYTLHGCADIPAIYCALPDVCFILTDFFQEAVRIAELTLPYINFNYQRAGGADKMN